MTIEYNNSFGVIGIFIIIVAIITTITLIISIIKSYKNSKMWNKSIKMANKEYKLRASNILKDMHKL